MTKLEWALKLAGMGFYVFPLKEPVAGDDKIGKRPAWSGWQAAATRDPEIITRYWSENPRYNIGIAYWMSGHCLVDIDIKNPEKNGAATWAKLCQGNPPDTLMWKSWSDGFHIIFRDPNGAIANSAGRLGDGIDTKGEGGYGVAPGSTILGKPYQELNICEPADLPQFIADAFGSAADHEQREAAEYSEEWAVEYASWEVRNDCGPWGQPPAQGTRNNQAMSRAVRLQRIGVPQDEALPLLREWAEKGEMPDEDLEGFIARAYEGKDSSFGSELPPRWETDGAAIFAEHFKHFAPEQDPDRIRGFDELTSERIAFYDEDRMLPRYSHGGAGMLFGFSSTSKTAIVLTWAHQLAGKGVRVLYVFGEEETEVRQRSDAIRAHYGLDVPAPDLLGWRPMPDFGHDAAMKKLADQMKAHGTQVCFLDTLAAGFANMKEIDQPLGVYTRRGLLGRLAHDTRALVLGIGHTSWEGEHEAGRAAQRHDGYVSLMTEANVDTRKMEERPTHIQVHALKVKGAESGHRAFYRLEPTKVPGIDRPVPVPVRCTKQEWAYFKVEKDAKEKLVPLLKLDDIQGILISAQAYDAESGISTAQLVGLLFPRREGTGIEDHAKMQHYIIRRLEEREREFAAANGWVVAANGIRELRWYKAR